MTDTQLQEFEKIIDRDQATVSAWLSEHAPNYHQEEQFERLVQVSGLDPNSPDVAAEFAATKWLEVNRPDYRDVVAATLAEIKQEITKNKDAIIGGDATQPAA